MGLDIGLGAANALVNILLFIATAVIGQLIEKTYARLACVELRKTGMTDATDCNEVHFLNHLFRFSLTRKKERGKTSWWVISLMLLLFVLLPCELLLEAGLIERHDCTPKNVRSMGVCASPWRGDGDVFVSSAMLMTQRAEWIDDKTKKPWSDVLEGMQKAPRPNEVHRANPKLEQTLVLGSCKVHTTSCHTEEVCGNLTIARTNSPYSTVVTDASIYQGRKDCAGDLTFDGVLGVAFYFCPDYTFRLGMRGVYSKGNSYQQNSEGGQRFMNSTSGFQTAGQRFKAKGKKWGRTSPRKEIRVLGVESILSGKQLAIAKKGSEKPWSMGTSLNRSRLYTVRCLTDGILARDLAKAIKLYRTTEFEQPGVRQENVGEDISNLNSLSVTDVLKAAFSLKAEDNSELCEGIIQEYTACGDFQMKLVLPFIIMSLFLVFLWLFFKVRLETDDSNFVPFDAPTWRTIAHNQAMAMRSTRSISSDQIKTPEIDEELGMGEVAPLEFEVARYTKTKYANPDPGQVPGAVYTKVFKKLNELGDFPDM